MILKKDNGWLSLELVIALCISCIFIIGAINTVAPKMMDINAPLADMARLDIALADYYKAFKKYPDNLELLKEQSRIPAAMEISRFTYTVAADKKKYRIEFAVDENKYSSPNSTY